MSDTDRLNNSLSQKNDLKTHAQYQSNRLDSAFPQVWLLAAALVMVVVLMVFSGWKIVNLDRERNQIAIERIRVEKDRERLENDIQEYTSTLKELPGLRDERDSLKRERDSLMGKVEAAKVRLASLKAEADKARTMLDKVKSDRSQVVADREAARTALAQLQNDIHNSRSTSELLRTQLTQLQEQEASLRKNVAGFRKIKSTIQADVDGLERRKDNLQQILATMAEDKGKLEAIAKRFNTIAKNLETTGHKADATVGDLQSRNKDLEGIISDVNGKVDVFSNQIKNMGSSSESLKATMRSIVNTSTEAESAALTMKKAGDGVETIITRLGTAAAKTDSQAQRLAKALEGSVRSIEGSSTALSTHNSKIGEQVDLLSGHLGNLKSIVVDLGDRTRSLQKSLKTIQKAAVRLGEINTQAAGAADALAKGQSSVVSQSQELQNVISQARNQLVSQSGRIAQDLKIMLGVVNDLRQRLGQIDGNIRTLENQIQGSEDQIRPR